MYFSVDFVSLCSSEANESALAAVFGLDDLWGLVEFVQLVVGGQLYKIS